MATARGDRMGGRRIDDVGQQTGSKRPAARAGAAKAAPKKGTIEQKGTVRPGSPVAGTSGARYARWRPTAGETPRPSRARA